MAFRSGAYINSQVNNSTGGDMKQPKKLTREQKKLLSEVGLNPKEWMKLHEDEQYLHIVRKGSSRIEIIDIEERTITRHETN